MRGAPYRDPPPPRARRRRALDPWYLALLFAWVCDAWAIATGVLERRGVGPELGFGALIVMTTVVALVVRLRRRDGTVRRDAASRS